MVGSLDPKKKRLPRHPDKFSACAEDKREEFEARAQGVFVVIDEMHNGR